MANPLVKTALIGRMDPFSPDEEDFVSYAERFEQYFLLNGITQEEVKVPMFITFCGASTYTLLKNMLFPKKPTEQTFAELVGVLTTHYAPKRLTIAERYNFHTRSQQTGENVKEFIIALKKLAEFCEFGDFLNDALRDRFVCGIESAVIRQRLLLESKLTFEQACIIATDLELAQKNSIIDGVTKFSNLEVGAVYRRAPNAKQNFHRQPDAGSSRRREDIPAQPGQRQENGRRTNWHQRNAVCQRCGRFHREDSCPARDWECFRCHGRGHASRMCRSREVREVYSDDWEIGPSDDISHSQNTHPVKPRLESQCIYLPAVKSVSGTSPLFVNMYVNGVLLAFEVDSGASVSLVSEETYHRYLNGAKLQKCTLSLKSVTGDQIKVKGKIEVGVSWSSGNASKSHTLELVVVSSTARVRPLMGRPWLDILSPEWRKRLLSCCVSNEGYLDVDDNNIFKFESNTTLEDNCYKSLLKDSKLLSSYACKYPNVFSRKNSNMIKQFKANLVIRENAIPIFHRPYSVPFALKGEVRKQLEEMVTSGVLRPVRHSEWASPIVCVPKADGGVRICVDFKVTLNRVLVTDFYPLPKLDDVFGSLAGGTVYCTLDLQNAYLQLGVGLESQKYLTVNTDDGLYQFTRLPFGISSAPGIFQSVMQEIVKGLPMVTCYLDDLLISGKDLKDCQERVEMVLNRLNEYNVRVNMNKCKWFCESVDYLGHTISAKGVCPISHKMKAILEAKVPQDVSQVRSFVGMLNFYHRFLPNLSSLLKPLYDLVKKDATWEWTFECNQAFGKCKELLLGHPLLVHYNPKYPIVVSADASPYGVGAVLSHLIDGVEKPVIFASSTLSSAQQNYSQLDREALALIFAVKRFHKYLYGQHFTLVSDHQPLRHIFAPDKGVPTVAAARLQRWSIVLSAYMYKIEYRKSTLLCPADALSRLPVPEENVVENVFSVLSVLPAKFPLTYVEVAKETEKDVVLSKVMDYTKHGWPNFVREPAIVPFFRQRYGISLENGCLLMGSKVIIPLKLQNDMLNLLHGSHPGIVRMKSLARSLCWWPNVNRDIEEKVKNCEACQIVNFQPDCSQKASWPRVDNWGRLHVDFFVMQKKYFLVIVDSESKWIEVYPMANGTDARKVCENLSTLFSTFGYPSQIVSDNGPPFNSKLFVDFCSHRGIEVLKSPAYHPQSNGIAERAVQTIKRLLAKELNTTPGALSDKNIHSVLGKILLAYRTTPLATGEISPSEKMFKYKPRTLLSLIKPPPNSLTFPSSRYPEYKVGEVVLVKIRPGMVPVKGVIGKRVSVVTYRVCIGSQCRYVHMNQLKRLPPTKIIPKPKVFPFHLLADPDDSAVDAAPLWSMVQTPLTISPRSSPSYPASVPTAEMVIPTANQSSRNTGPELRRSNRPSKAPQRLDL
ncbi:uncharacterized protein K02A2.6-like [Ischnura elegans]|uniref:uncharacterized protein K02A2.6-like n=1 Tax=Ischnura elegans TaxID=197161 RepID=UPI001ED86CE1|nr:uncharacterized protein K02A2.6-like [Ischnura elegans]